MASTVNIPKLLVANRGEIAVRIFRACYDLGIHTVAIYSNEDANSLFRTKADEAYLVGEKKSPLGAYLDIPGIIGLARRRGVADRYEVNSAATSLEEIGNEMYYPAVRKLRERGSPGSPIRPCG